MGFRLDLVISSPVDAASYRQINNAALSRWSFVRVSQRGEYDARVLFAAPELTSYLFDDDASYELAVEQCHQLAEQLPELTDQFRGVTFAHIAADCFGGTCLYFGYCCRDGEIFFKTGSPAADCHVRLLQYVDVETSGHFGPFERGFFTACNS